jgi:paraquat-inducible protein B
MNEPKAQIVPRKPVVKRKQWSPLFVWFIPMMVLIGVGFYFKAFLSQRGPLITLTLNSAEGIRVGQTPLLHKGVPIGEVSEVDLTEDEKKVYIRVRLKRDRENFAKEGAVFWVVRPEISDAGFQGFGAIFSGPYLDSIPGKGDEKLEFTGLESAPDSLGDGLHIILHTARLGHLAPHSPVTFRGIEVGSVKEVKLNRDGSGVDIHLVVSRRYSALVRKGTKFWADGGFDVKGGLFSGIEMKLDSLRSFVSGGIAFATPDKNMGAEAKEEDEYPLEDTSQKEWLAWNSHIPISPKSGNISETVKPLPLDRHDLNDKEKK